MRLSFLAVAGVFVAGVFVGFCSLVTHRHGWPVAGVGVPWGLMLCLATGYAAGRAAGLLAGTAGAVAFGLGWLAVVAVGFPPRPEGDYLVAGDLRGLGFAVGGTVMVAAAVVRSVTRRPADRG